MKPWNKSSECCIPSQGQGSSTGGSCQQNASSPGRFPRYQFDTKENGWTLKVHLPGVSKENIEIKVDEGMLRLHAVKKTDLPKEYKPLHTEISRSDYDMEWYVGDQIDVDKIEAHMEAGLLTLTLPKTQSTQAKRIQIR